MNAPLMVDPKNLTDPLEIATKELEEGKVKTIYNIDANYSQKIFTKR